MEVNTENFYDFIIIGAGAAGCSAAIYGARAGLKTLVVDINAGGQILQIDTIENYPGVFPAVNGADLSRTMKTQAEFFGSKFVTARVTGIDKIKNIFSVKTKMADSSVCTYTSTALLVATGADHNRLGVKGETELIGAGVSYCAVCDGAFFKEKNVVVVGGGNSAVSEALYLSEIASHVTVVLRKNKFRAHASLVERLSKKENVNVRYETTVKEICGKGRVESLQITRFGENDEIQCDAVFILVGMSPVTELVAMLPHEKNGALITTERMETAMPGLFVAGDVRAKPFRQIVTATSDGAIAALAAAEYVDMQKMELRCEA